MNSPLSIEQAAEQLTDYLYPRGSLIGTAWIQGDVLLALARELYRALERKRTKERHDM